MKLGRGRPKKKDACREQMNLRLDAEMIAKLNYLSAETGVSKSDILRRGIEMQHKFYVVTH